MTPSRDIAPQLATRAFVATMLVALYYLAYRYPFQINSSLTSPTYADTPPYLQVGKELLLAATVGIAVLVAGVAAQWRPRIPGQAFPGVQTVMALVTCWAFARAAVTNNIETLSFGFMLGVGVLLCPLALRWSLDMDRLAWHLKFYAALSVAATIVEYWLYQHDGRLPALAYAGTVSVRFGAILDDPNGFAVLVALLLPAAWIGWREHRVWRLATCAGLLAALVLTESFTGVVAVMTAVLAGGVWLLWRSPVRTAGVVWITVAAGVIGWTYLASSDWFGRLLATKSGSFAAHAESASVINSLDWPTALGFGTQPGFSESGYAALIQMLGVPATILYVAVGIVAVRRLRRSLSSAAARGAATVYGAFFFYEIAYLLALINLHLMSSFPADLLFGIGIVVSLFRAKDVDPDPSCATQPEPSVADSLSRVSGRHRRWY